MPKFQIGDMVMGRWPGSNLYYEVKVLSYDAETHLYTVIYKDGTELELKEADIKSQTGFRQSGGSRSRSRSRSPARRQSRSRSPGRTPRRSSSRSRESRKDTKLKELLEVRLSPVAKPVENNSNNKHEKKDENDAADKEKSESDVEKSLLRVSGRYNLRRRKDDAATKAAQQDELKKTEELLPRAKKWATAKTTELDFGGRIGAFLLMLSLPLVAFALLLTCQADGSILCFPPPVPPLHAFWSAQVFGITLLWLLFQAVLYVLPVGKVADGMPLRSGEKVEIQDERIVCFSRHCCGCGSRCVL
ncbi:hypothetical protein SKAU_G00181930 [Synaphobranchus kaupii]|uniref:Tudor domain-containing protein n=1 Tax=Synaphobranchus kaupii TaxID=118154 RepID=A0A9Q1FC08_SYNKA|nr:hypothetical protein SKAU_G00181930 [Synaphobranchus kaupii]